MSLRIIAGMCLLALSGLAFLGILDVREYYIPYFLATILALASSLCFMSALSEAKRSVAAVPTMHISSRVLTVLAIVFGAICFAGGLYAYGAYQNDVQLKEGVADLDQHDYVRAYQTFQKLAERGDSVAQANIGDLYSFGLGVKQDTSEALKWYHRAANQGNLYVSKLFAESYEAGTLGLPKDIVQAYVWKSITVRMFNDSWDTGRPTQSFLDDQRRDFARLESKMTPEEILQAKVMANKWSLKKEHFFYCSSRNCSTLGW